MFTKSLGIIWFNPCKEKEATIDAWLVFLLKLTSSHTKLPSLLDQAKLHVLPWGPRARSTLSSLVILGPVTRMSQQMAHWVDYAKGSLDTQTCIILLDRQSQNNQDTKCLMRQRWCQGDAAEISNRGGEGTVHPEVNLTDTQHKAEPEALPKQEFQGLWGVICGNKSWEEHKTPHRKTIEKTPMMQSRAAHPQASCASEAWYLSLALLCSLFLSSQRGLPILMMTAPTSWAKPST